MTDSLNIALAQLNPTVGDMAGNAKLVREARAKAAAAGADLVVASELIVTGYPPEDIVVRGAFLDAAAAAVDGLMKDTADGGPALIIGTPWRIDGKVHNAALLLEGGKIAAVRLKHDLPNYGVFDEKRVFVAGPMPGPVNFRGVRLGLQICEDMWTPDVSECLQESGAELLVVINGSPFDIEKPDRRLNLAIARVQETGLPLIYVNQVGGQDELVFDGASFAVNSDFALAAHAKSWESDLVLTKWARKDETWHCDNGVKAAPPEKLASIYGALVMGLRDYVGKNGFPGVIIGLSGGIDSAITAAVAADALGPGRVRCVMMPSPYTSKESLEDAAAVAKMLGVKLDSISIEPAMKAFDAMLKPAFGNLPPDITEENLQARARGITLMALSNKTGWMVLSTGNKSEMSAGYATLYGDMCGGYSVLKDVYKTTVFALSKWRNAHGKGPAMPERVITKPPTAELKPNQKDEDTLPPYSTLDAVLERLVERDMSIADVAKEGFDEALVARVWRMLQTAEYKRRQAPPGVKISSRSLSRDRRYPITNAFKGPR
jgi:NAD+ synthase